MITKRLTYGLVLILNVLVVYSNHFQNDFQFDDINAIPNNPAIRQPGTMLKAFVEPNFFSAAPEQRTYRPVTTASLALDYWLAGGMKLFFFHLSTFVWYCLLLVLMFSFFERLMDLAAPHPWNFWTALAAAAVFGLHPACAETINYIIQRADLYNALGSVASLWIFMRYPAQRKFGCYLLPATLAMLAKPPALIFPLLLLAYVLLFEAGNLPAARRWRNALAAALPALAVAAAAAIFMKRMQPATWSAGAASASLYRLTQPFVALHYFKSFFLPTELNVDPGWHYVAPLSLPAVSGYLFVLSLAALAFFACCKPAGKPVAFGIVWFFVTLLPTSLMPLRDVTNDHRMFFAFVGLTLAAVWCARLALVRLSVEYPVRRSLAYGCVTVLAITLVAEGAATRGRNRVWLTRKSLWADSVAQNPSNPRALNNYGAILYDQGDYESAFEYWQRAVNFDPERPVYQANVIRVATKLHKDDLAELYLRKIVATYPSNAAGYITYADWLTSKGRFDEAAPLLDRARQLDPQSEDVKHARSDLFARRYAADRIAVFRALDTDHDGQLSTEEMIAAPAVLLTLDRNGDGKLSAIECGADLGDVSRMSASQLRAASVRFMSSNPLLAALDADHNGEISEREIRNAEQALEQLDRNHDGILEGAEIAPPYVIAFARSLLTQWDSDHGRRIQGNECDNERRRELLDGASVDGDPSLNALADEIFYWADQDRDGVVTREELDFALRAGTLPPAAGSADGGRKPPF
jgi:tetratricopeptide (TPR) repeat protein